MFLLRDKGVTMPVEGESVRTVRYGRKVRSRWRATVAPWKSEDLRI